MKLNLDLLSQGLLVTGASGFIGSRLVNRLAGIAQTGDNKWQIKALVRRLPDGDESAQSDSIAAAGKRIHLLKGDLTDKKSLKPLSGPQYDVVFHLAATTPEAKGSKERLRQVNLDGTKNLFDAVCDRTDHFVYVSGTPVFEPADQNRRVIDEESPKKIRMDYIQLRLAAEAYLREKCKAQGIDLTVVYFPQIVYGNDGAFRTHFLERISNGGFRIPGKGDYVVNLLHLDDAVDILVTIAAKKSQTANQSYIASDSNPAQFRDLVDFIADRFKVKHPGTVPLVLAKMAVGSDVIDMLTDNVRASNEKIKKIYDFHYPSYVDGMPSVISEFTANRS